MTLAESSVQTDKLDCKRQHLSPRHLGVDDETEDEIVPAVIVMHISEQISPPSEYALGADNYRGGSL